MTPLLVTVMGCTCRRLHTSLLVEFIDHRLNSRIVLQLVQEHRVIILQVQSIVGVFPPAGQTIDM